MEVLRGEGMEGMQETENEWKEISKKFCRTDWSFQFRKDTPSANKMSKERLISRHIILKLQNIGIKKRFL